MQRVRFFALAGILLLLLSACAQSRREEEPAPGPPPTFQGTLVLAAAPDLPGSDVPLTIGTDWLTRQIQAFESSHAGLRVELRPYTTAAEMEQALRSGDPPPDLYFGRFLPELAGMLADLRPVVTLGALQRFQPGALAAFGRGSALHGIPLLLETPVLALNRTAFETAGIPLPDQGRWTQAEFEQTLARFEAGGRPALLFYQLQGFYDWLPLAGLLFTADGGVAAGAEEGLKRLQRYRSEGWLHPDSAKLPPEQTWRLFAAPEGGPAILPVSPWAIPLLREPPFSVSLALAAFPGGVTTGRSYGLTAFEQKDSLKLKAAADLALFLARPEPLLPVSRKTGLLPADLSSGNPFASDPVLKDLISHLRGFQPLPSGAIWDRAEPGVARTLHLAAVSGISPAEAAGALSRHLKEAATPAVR